MLFLCPILAKVSRFDHCDSPFSDCLSEKSEKKEKISDSFFKSVGSYKSFGKVFWGSTHNREGTKTGKPSVHVVSCKSKWIWISWSRRWWRKRSHRQHNQQRDSLILDLYFWKKTKKKKENWWCIQYISFIFPFLTCILWRLLITDAPGAGQMHFPSGAFNCISYKVLGMKRQQLKARVVSIGTDKRSLHQNSAVY